jgi:hypothetical protein
VGLAKREACNFNVCEQIFIITLLPFFGFHNSHTAQDYFTQKRARFHQRLNVARATLTMKLKLFRQNENRAEDSGFLSHFAPYSLRSPRENGIFHVTFAYVRSFPDINIH